MTIPIFVLLVIYMLIVVIFGIFSFFLVYHAVRFGTATLVNFLTVLVYIVVAGGLLLWSYNYISGIDWSQPLIFLL